MAISTIKDLDRYYMNKAIEQAKIAYDKHEIPIGCVVVGRDGEVIGAGYNQSQNKQCQLYHAETLAIKEACAYVNDWRLNNCTIYITLEPCVMCMGLICLSRIERIVFAAKSPIFGCNIDKEDLPQLYQKHVQGITQGVMKDESESLLKLFFKQKRGEK